MMNPRDLAAPAAALAGTVVLAAGAAVAGYLVLSRDRERLKQAVRMAADLAERAAWRFGEAREDLADLWAEARDEARRDIEARAFAAAAAGDGDGEGTGKGEGDGDGDGDGEGSARTDADDDADDAAPATAAAPDAGEPPTAPARRRRASGTKRGATKAG